MKVPQFFILSDADMVRKMFRMVLDPDLVIPGTSADDIVEYWASRGLKLEYD